KTRAARARRSAPSLPVLHRSCPFVSRGWGRSARGAMRSSPRGEGRLEQGPSRDPEHIKRRPQKKGLECRECFLDCQRHLSSLRQRGAECSTFVLMSRTKGDHLDYCPTQLAVPRIRSDEKTTTRPPDSAA